MRYHYSGEFVLAPHVAHMRVNDIVWDREYTQKQRDKIIHDFYYDDRRRRKRKSRRDRSHSRKRSDSVVSGDGLLEVPRTPNVATKKNQKQRPQAERARY